MIATIVSMSNPPEAKKQVYVDFNKIAKRRILEAQSLHAFIL